VIVRFHADVVATPRGLVEMASAGAGDAVLLVHGSPGDWRQLLPLAEDLADRFQVMLVSRPGYGRTPLGANRTAAEQAALFVGMLDALGIDGAAVVGVSGGGPAAVALAAAFPSRVTSVVLCCAVAPEMVRVPRAMRAATLPGVGEVLASLDRRLGVRPSVVERAVAGLTPDERRRYDADPALRADVERFVADRPRGRTALAGIRNDVAQFGRPRAPFVVTAPTLVLHGDTDPTVALGHARFHAAAIPGAVVEVYADAGHAFLLTRRREASSRIAAHVAPS
jgi:pimeloyl-ACP methyl ester carboxylesterase